MCHPCTWTHIGIIPCFCLFAEIKLQNIVFLSNNAPNMVSTT
uniref:Uncharacterized protein n=1 Tax=Anguilla anguilla TaxID=7936 RepID=A0A0E9RWV7_ANGAN